MVFLLKKRAGSNEAVPLEHVCGDVEDIGMFSALWRVLMPFSSCATTEGTPH